MKTLGRILEILIITILIMVAVIIVGGLSSCKVVNKPISDKQIITCKQTGIIEVLPTLKPKRK